ncbi:MAG: OadG family protein, partial [Spirochaetaceae bacterium]|nr:OadG family protein [Spirochaetaceae bacterium]
MTIVDMLQQSIYLTLLGMGVVFSFLIIMIVCMVLTHKVLHAL